MQKKLSFVPPVGTPNVPALNVAEQIQEMAQSLATNRMGTQRPDDIVDGELWHKLNSTTQEITPYLWRTSDGDGDGTIPGYVLHPKDADAHKELFAGVPRVPALDPELVGKALALVPQADGTFIWQEVGGGVPVGVEAWCSGTTPPPGWLDMSIDNGPLPRAAYPALWKFAESSGNIITDAEWLEQAATQRGSCGAFSTGDDSTTFRIPMHIRVFSRARDIWNNVNVGMWQPDVIRNIAGNLASIIGLEASDTPTGAFATVATPAPGRGYQAIGNAAARLNTFSADRVVPTGDENRPVSIVRLPIIKAWDVPVIPATLEVGELVNQIADVSDRVNSEAHIRALAGNRVWTSAEYTPVANTRTIVTHGIPNIDLDTACAEVCLKCIVAEYGYTVGDLVMGASTRIYHVSAQLNSPFQILLRDTTISTMMGSILDSWSYSGATVNFTLTNWRLIFKIWY